MQAGQAAFQDPAATPANVAAINGTSQLDPTLAATLNRVTHASNEDHPPQVQHAVAPTKSRELSADERNKLMVVFESIDSANIVQQTLQNSQSEFSSLAQALTTPTCTLSQLKSTIGEATMMALFASTDLPQTQVAAINEFHRVANALVDQLDVSVRLKPGKREQAEPESSSRPTKRFMLHRGVGEVDLFTSAGQLREADLAQLANSRDTDIISVQGASTTMAAQKRPVPTLGSSNPRPRAIARPVPPPETRPVDFLYYDAFASFAPTYDSSPSSLSYTQSSVRSKSRAAIEAHDRDLSSDVALSHPRPPPISTTENSPSESILSKDNADLLRELGIDAAEFEASVVDLENEQRTWHVLAENGALLTRLLKARIARLRLGSQAAQEAEREAGSQLLSSFVDLLAKRPRSLSSARSVLPPAALIESATPRILESVARDPIYYGSAEDYNVRAVKNSALETPK